MFEAEQTLRESEERYRVTAEAATDVRERRGKFEEVNRGTIFLDEVADLSPNAQAKILRVLQERSLSRLGSNNLVHLDTGSGETDRDILFRGSKNRPGKIDI